MNDQFVDGFLSAETRQLSPVKQLSAGGFQPDGEQPFPVAGVEILNKNAWLCSNKEMVDQISGDDRTAICYTIGELQKLIELNPSKDFLKKVHDVKSVFEDSRIIKTKNITGED